jgi:hypothetical protein
MRWLCLDGSTSRSKSRGESGRVSPKGASLRRNSLPSDLHITSPHLSLAFAFCISHPPSFCHFIGKFGLLRSSSASLKGSSPPFTRSYLTSITLFSLIIEFRSLPCPLTAVLLSRTIVSCPIQSLPSEKTAQSHNIWDFRSAWV